MIDAIVEVCAVVLIAVGVGVCGAALLGGLLGVGVGLLATGVVLLGCVLVVHALKARK